MKNKKTIIVTILNWKKVLLILKIFNIINQWRNKPWKLDKV